MTNQLQKKTLLDKAKLIRVFSNDENSLYEIMGNDGFNDSVENQPDVYCIENENVSKEYWKTKYISASY